MVAVERRFMSYQRFKKIWSDVLGPDLIRVVKGQSSKSCSKRLKKRDSRLHRRTNTCMDDHFITVAGFKLAWCWDWVEQSIHFIGKLNISPVRCSLSDYANSAGQYAWASLNSPSTGLYSAVQCNVTQYITLQCCAALYIIDNAVQFCEVQCSYVKLSEVEWSALHLV